LKLKLNASGKRGQSQQNWDSWQPHSLPTHQYQTTVYCLMTGSQRCEQLARSHYAAVPWPGIGLPLTSSFLVTDQHWS